jgi:serine protease Do
MTRHHDGHQRHSHAPMDDYPVAVIVHLSGPRRGATDRLAGEFLTIGSSEEADVHLVDLDPGHKPDIRGGLVCRGATYELVAEPGRKVWVNGVETSRTDLDSGDVIEVGRGGPLLRYRLYPPESAAYKTVAEAFDDCLECTKHGEAGRIRRATAFAVGFPRELLTQTSRVFRATVMVALLGLGVSTTVLARRGAVLETRLSEELTRVQGLSDLLQRAAEETLSHADLESLRSDVEVRLQSTMGRIGELEARSGDLSSIVEGASRSTLFVQGAYGFEEPSTGHRLRIALAADGRPLTNGEGQPSLTLGGEGPVFEVPYTGTGFVVENPGGRRLIMTNRHVALPWEFDDAATGILQSGFRGVMLRLRVFLPGAKSAVGARLDRASDAADVALLAVEGMPLEVAPLVLTERAPTPGEDVVVLGYPLGIRALVARAELGVIAEIEAAGATGFWAVAEHLAAANGIQPLASRGIVGQVSGRSVVYDAETTSGGSGGPVLNSEGKVVAVNAAILPEFGGSNMGVPIGYARELLDGGVRNP